MITIFIIYRENIDGASVAGVASKKETAEIICARLGMTNSDYRYYVEPQTMFDNFQDFF